jgi:glycosyltransferase involved in cell wall biosynthesis
MHVNSAHMTDNSSGSPPVSASRLAHDEKAHANYQAGASNAPLISVCMPVYNAKRYLEEAIESILGQTFKDFEFLISDDGSTDRSLAILKRYAAQDGRIRLWSRPNAGYVVRLNEMLHQARGDLIARMDADDVALPERFAQQVEFLRSHPEVDVVGGARENIDSKGRLLFVHHEAESHDDMQSQFLNGFCPISHPTVMMRRRAVLAVGGYRTEMMPAEDVDLWLRMSERGRLANLADVMVRYRIHESSVSASQQQQQISRMQVAVDGACDRRGIPRRELNIQPWRSADRQSRHRESMIYGWAGFHGGNRSTAVHYGLRAVSLMPWRRESWLLLACAILKMKAGQGPDMSPRLQPQRIQPVPTKADMSTLPSSGVKCTVSVVVPLYNTEKYIAECIGSILDQTLPDVEVLVVDDGSRDRSAEIVQEIASRDSRVRLLRHPGGINLGVSRTRRLGIEEASGEYIAFLDADDAFEPSKLERQIDLMKAHPACVMCHTAMQPITGHINTHEIQSYFNGRANCILNLWNGFQSEITEYSLLDRHDALKTSVICNSSVVARTAAIRATPAATRQLFQYEDWAQWVLLSTKGAFVFTPEPLTRYRLHADSSSYPIHQNILRDPYSTIEFLLMICVLTNDEKLKTRATCELPYSLARIATIYADRGTSEGTDLLSQSPQPLLDFTEYPWVQSVMQLQLETADLRSQVSRMADRLARIDGSKAYRSLVKARNVLNKIRNRSQ